jgi:hypothetical protein
MRVVPLALRKSSSSNLMPVSITATIAPAPALANVVFSARDATKALPLLTSFKRR